MKQNAIVIILIMTLILFNCSKDKESLDDSLKLNEDIDLGLISDQSFNTNGSFILEQNELIEENGNYYSTDDSQRIIFSINAYSKFNISVQNFFGDFSLYNKTTHEALTRRDSRTQSIGFSGNDDFETELDEGDYELKMSRGNDQEIVWQLQIENMNDLRPYKNLGVLSLPYNQNFINDTERKRRTVYGFEILEDSDWKIYGVTDPYSPEKAVILYDSKGEILFSLQDSYTFPEPINIPLQKGKYSLSFFTEMNLILGDNEFGDQDFGEILTLPYSQEYSINFNYDTNRTQHIYFQTTSPSLIGLTYSTFGSHEFALYKLDGTLMALNFYWASSDTLPAGSYYIESRPIGSPYSDEYGDSQPYSSFLSGTYLLELNELE